ncbi:rod shape-determining protein RodA [Bermanella marisrubri]|uniref:Peptidoglycan glycosyltransferase MrdB n=1 Tax=Bermanella marisrubri TaxID=207949 RepID=Q1N081_9GAMM|nr:rod shape-determining protein RodA [Bermanella marisrubri]EAT11636.1 rod shape-determining protein RodA [Oceanobacter sp. RED65] [Bermanella marisrubri]QIZ83323.1 rod shape-determining protein RodA [Bermanella marisrubri]
MAGDFTRTLDMGAQKRSIWQSLHIDLPLLVLLLMLMSTSLFVLYSASGENLSMVYRQMVYFGLGLFIMFVVAQFHPLWFQMFAPWAFTAVVIALLLVLLVGVGAKGAQRWLSVFGLFRFQPSELMKLVMPMMVAWYLASKLLPPSFKHIVVTLLIVFIPTFLVMRQPDLGTSLLIAAAGLLVLLFAGLSWRYILGAAGAALVIFPMMWLFVMHDYQKQRVLTFLDPESDPLGAGWNIIQSKTAIGSGGIEGKGYLEGTQSQLEFLPERHTDFIIAVFAEEQGLIGVVLLLLLYGAIVMRGLYMASRGRDTFDRLFAGALIVTFFIYVFVNIGMVSGILPVVGVPLPLISYGGTSIVTLMAAFGVIMSVYMHRRV